MARAISPVWFYDIWRTLNCVQCGLRRAARYCGHVHHDDAGVVTAGWCDTCHEATGGTDNLGPCRGPWKTRYGLTGEDSNDEDAPITLVVEEGSDDDGMYPLH